MTEFFDRTLDNLRSGPLGPVVGWIERHPRLSAWFVLALGMIILLVIEARDVGLLPGQWVALIVTTALVAGACIWIISWEDEEEAEEAEAESEEEEAEADASEEAAEAES
jgi:protein-S-isoprenylcysteine O-methyltransferase Ste14